MDIIQQSIRYVNNYFLDGNRAIVAENGISILQSKTPTP